MTVLRRSSKEYSPKLHDKIIQSVLEGGGTPVNVASALGIRTQQLATWRRHYLDLNDMMTLLEEKTISNLSNEYAEYLENGNYKEAKIIQERLATLCHYYLDHTYVTIPELVLENDLYKRHEIVLSYVAQGKISLEIGERLSKLIKDNAEIYNSSELMAKLVELESALSAIIKD